MAVSEANSKNSDKDIYEQYADAQKKAIEMFGKLTPEKQKQWLDNNSKTSRSYKAISDFYNSGKAPENLGSTTTPPPANTASTQTPEQKSKIASMIQKTVAKNKTEKESGKFDNNTLVLKDPVVAPPPPPPATTTNTNTPAKKSGYNSKIGKQITNKKAPPKVEENTKEEEVRYGDGMKPGTILERGGWPDDSIKKPQDNSKEYKDFKTLPANYGKAPYNDGINREPIKDNSDFSYNKSKEEFINQNSGWLTGVKKGDILNNIGSPADKSRTRNKIEELQNILDTNKGLKSQEEKNRIRKELADTKAYLEKLKYYGY